MKFSLRNTNYSNEFWNPFVQITHQITKGICKTIAQRGEFYIKQYANINIAWER